MDEKVEAALARCLARTYRSIDWKSVGVKSAYTFFADGCVSGSGNRIPFYEQ